MGDERPVLLTHIEIACALAAVNAVADSLPHDPPPVFKATAEKLKRALASDRPAFDEDRDG